jgi:hypothetical protein
MTQIADHVTSRAASCLAHTIGMVKIVLISLIALGTLLAMPDSESLGLIMIVLAGSASAACVYVVFGWLEHTLLLLMEIADNTAAGPRPPGSSED